MSAWDLGDEVPLRHKVYASGVLSAATVTLAVTAPDGTASAPTVTTPSTGYYDALVPTTQVGIWRFEWSISGAVPDDVVSGSFEVQDPSPPVYYGLDAFRAALSKRDTDTARDELLLSCLAAASRGIDAYCGGRQFWKDQTATARLYRTRSHVDASDDDGELLLTDDIASTAGLVVEVGNDGTSWTTLTITTDFDVEPANALAKRWPITGLRRVNGKWSTYRLARVTAPWGWPAIPDPVVEATRIQATRLYRRKDSPEGITGNAEWGPIRLSRVDPDVQSLIAHLVQHGIG